MDPGYFDTHRERNPSETASVFSKLCFWYLRPIFVKGRQGDLSISDIYRCIPDQRASLQGDAMGEAWRQELDTEEEAREPSLLRVILKLHGPRFILANFIYIVFHSTIRLSTPWCLERLIQYFSPTHSGIQTGEAYLYAVGVVSLMTIAAGSIHSMLIFLLDISTKVKAGCCSLVYRKLLRLDLSAGGKATEGLTAHIVNLMTTDIQRFDHAALYLMDLVRTPIESSITVYLMYQRIGVSTFIGVAFLLLFIPLQGYLGKVTSRLRRLTAVRTDNRIRLMNEVIQSIEAIKMFVWEKAFARIIGKARRKEMNVIKKMSWVRAVMISCVKLNTKVAVFLSIISFISLGNELTAAKIFVIYSYYDILKYGLVDYLPLSIAYCLESYVGLQRIKEFLLLPEVENEDGVDLVKLDTTGENVFEKFNNGAQTYVKSDYGSEGKAEYLIRLKDFTAHWKNIENKKVAQTNVALSEIKLDIMPGTLTTVLGTVGSGKSTLLLAMLRELTPASGHIHVNGNIAYAPQDPWIFEASIRQNILFGEELDLRRYKQVIKCCQLKSDLDILHHGDRTVVGERGASLSGGQRARLSLARCVYRAADVYLLDDPIAAVDAKVGQAIYQDCVRGFLRDKAVVLVTHHVQYARQADTVCVLRAGKIEAQGTYQELKSSIPELEKLIETRENSEEENQKQKKVSYEKQDNVEYNRNLSTQSSMSEISQISFNMDLDNKSTPTYEGEVQSKGSVGGAVYLKYVRSGAEGGTVLSLLALFLLAQLFYSSSDVWLKDWVNLEEAYGAKTAHQHNITSGTPASDYESLPSNRFHLTREQFVYVYAALIGICIFFTWNKLLVFYNTCIRASVTLHDNMFRGVTNAPMWFYHHNPSGRILNRFSKDMGQVDTLLPVALVDCLGFFLEIVAILVVVCTVNWWLVLPTAVVASLLHLVRTIYIWSSRDLKRIEAIAKSHSLNHATATVSGLTTIRSSREQQRTLAREFDKLLDLHTSSWFLMISANRAFGFWMDMVCCVYLAMVTFSFFLFNAQGGNVGLAITQVITLVSFCQVGMRQTAEVENQMTSVERILEYTDLPSEQPTEPDLKRLKTELPDLDFEKWPSTGEIVFEDVSLEYEKPPKETEERKVEEPSYAIRGVNFTVKGGEKVAVVGRTGAGKSSLIAALFRLNRTGGRVMVDGVTAEQAGLSRWRTRLCALPQRPALFAGALRDNLDPEGLYTDADIYRALGEVNLGGGVWEHAEGLSWRVGDGGGNLSTGQRQLLCLARAALSRPRVLILDEATANVDDETDKNIQMSIRSKFAESTVLTIAHRLHTVMDYDRVIVMDKGRVAESGHPHELLTRASRSETHRRSAFTKAQAPLAIPEYGVYDDPKPSHKVTETSRSISVDEGIFKSLVEQTGEETTALLYKMAEESYRELQKKHS